MSKIRYTEEQLEFIRTGYKTMPLSELAPLFNTRFNLNVTWKTLNSAAANHGITCGRNAGERIVPCRLYIKEQAEFLRKNYPGRSLKELTDLFNARFGENKTERQIKTFVHNRHITSGRTGRFEGGHRPWNRGKKGYIGANRTSFKKGNIPPNRKPLGAERIDSKDGYIQKKIAEKDPYTGFPTRFKNKHVHIWEMAHGPVPKGQVVAFKDGDMTNCILENLMMIPRSELLVLNLHKYREAPEEIKTSLHVLAKLEVKAGIRTRPGRGRGIRH